MMIPCQLSTFSEFISNAFQFHGLIAQNKVNAWKITNEVKRVGNYDVALNGAIWTQKNNGGSNIKINEIPL